jgi:hypothetical protein
MKNLIKITTISSLLIIVCLLIGACGSGGSEFVQGQGKVEIWVANNVTGAPLQGVTIEVRENSQTGTLIETHTNATDANGHYTWVSPTAGVGSNFYFTFIKTGFVNLQDTILPELTTTKTAIERMIPAT